MSVVVNTPHTSGFSVPQKDLVNFAWQFMEERRTTPVMALAVGGESRYQSMVRAAESVDTYLGNCPPQDLGRVNRDNEIAVPRYGYSYWDPKTTFIVDCVVGARVPGDHGTRKGKFARRIYDYGDILTNAPWPTGWARDHVYGRNVSFKEVKRTLGEYYTVESNECLAHRFMSLVLGSSWAGFAEEDDQFYYEDGKSDTISGASFTPLNRQYGMHPGFAIVGCDRFMLEGVYDGGAMLEPVGKKPEYTRVPFATFGGIVRDGGQIGEEVLHYTATYKPLIDMWRTDDFEYIGIVGEDPTCRVMLKETVQCWMQPQAYVGGRVNPEWQIPMDYQDAVEQWETYATMHQERMFEEKNEEVEEKMSERINRGEAVNPRRVEVSTRVPTFGFTQVILTMLIMMVVGAEGRFIPFRSFASFGLSRPVDILGGNKAVGFKTRVGHVMVDNGRKDSSYYYALEKGFYPCPGNAETNYNMMSALYRSKSIVVAYDTQQQYEKLVGAAVGGMKYSGNVVVVKNSEDSVDDAIEMMLDFQQRLLERKENTALALVVEAEALLQQPTFAHVLFTLVRLTQDIENARGGDRFNAIIMVNWERHTERYGCWDGVRVDIGNSTQLSKAFREVFDLVAIYPGYYFGDKKIPYMAPKKYSSVFDCTCDDYYASVADKEFVDYCEEMNAQNEKYADAVDDSEYAMNATAVRLGAKVKNLFGFSHISSCSKYLPLAYGNNTSEGEDKIKEFVKMNEEYYSRQKLYICVAGVIFLLSVIVVAIRAWCIHSNPSISATIKVVNKVANVTAYSRGVNTMPGIVYEKPVWLTVVHAVLGASVWVLLVVSIAFLLFDVTIEGYKALAVVTVCYVAVFIVYALAERKPIVYAFVFIITAFFWVMVVRMGWSLAVFDPVRMSLASAVSRGVLVASCIILLSYYAIEKHQLGAGATRDNTRMACVFKLPRPCREAAGTQVTEKKRTREARSFFNSKRIHRYGSGDSGERDADREDEKHARDGVLAALPEEAADRLDNIMQRHGRRDYDAATAYNTMENEGYSYAKVFGKMAGAKVKKALRELRAVDRQHQDAADYVANIGDDRTFFRGPGRKRESCAESSVVGFEVRVKYRMCKTRKNGKAVILANGEEEVYYEPYAFETDYDFAIMPIAKKDITEGAAFTVAGGERTGFFVQDVMDAIVAITKEESEAFAAIECGAKESRDNVRIEEMVNTRVREAVGKLVKQMPSPVSFAEVEGQVVENRHAHIAATFYGGKVCYHTPEGAVLDDVPCVPEAPVKSAYDAVVEKQGGARHQREASVENGAEENVAQQKEASADVDAEEKEATRTETRIFAIKDIWARNKPA